MFFLRKTSTIHIELLFRNAPARSSRTDLSLVCFAGATPPEILIFFLRIGNGVGKQGYSNRPPIDDRNPIRKISIDCLDASKTNEQTQPQVTRYSAASAENRGEKPIRNFSIDPASSIRTSIADPVLRTPFPRLLFFALGQKARYTNQKKDFLPRCSLS